MFTKAWRWRSFSLQALPGALPSIRPSGPRALNRTTQSRSLQPDPADPKPWEVSRVDAATRTKRNRCGLRYETAPDGCGVRR